MMYENRCLHGNAECTRCGFPKDEFQRGQQHAAEAIVTWLREVAETMRHRGVHGSGLAEDLAEAVERGEWKT